MGKASKWIRNFLVGKKEERESTNKNNKKRRECNSISTVQEEDVITKAIVPAATIKVRRRWSFGRLDHNHTTNTKSSSSSSGRSHKSSLSLDSFVTTKLVAHALVEYEKSKVANKTTPFAGLAKTLKSGPVEGAAATKIQAAFRSYLARKALCALRGLVKLQALVRGHLVRKQTTAMMHCMHALMAIQVRARVHRIQMAEEEQLLVKRQTNHKELLAHDNHLSKSYGETVDMNINEARRVLKTKSGHINHPQIERTEHRNSTYYHSRRFSFSNQEELQIYPTQPVKSMDVSSRTSSQDYQLLPSYMANTESSRAKVRSQSEPKQRPNWGLKQKYPKEEVQIQSSSSHLRQSNSEKNNHQYPWLIKLYRSTKIIKDTDFDCDSTSTTNYDSNYRKALIAYEPPVNLY